MKNGWENKYKIKKVTGIKRFYVNDECVIQCRLNLNIGCIEMHLIA